jgi:hypothetical protein
MKLIKEEKKIITGECVQAGSWHVVVPPEGVNRTA